MFVPGCIWQVMHCCGRNLRRELMLDRVARLVFRNARVGRLRKPLIAGLAHMSRTAAVLRVVRVNDMACRAAGRAVIAGVIVGPEKVQRRVEQACFLQAEIDRIGAVVGAKPARAQSFIGLSVLFFFVRQTDLEPPFAAPLKDAEDVARLRDFPPRERLKRCEKSLNICSSRVGCGI